MTNKGFWVLTSDQRSQVMDMWPLEVKMKKYHIWTSRHKTYIWYTYIMPNQIFWVWVLTSDQRSEVMRYDLYKVNHYIMVLYAFSLTNPQLEIICRNIWKNPLNDKKLSKYVLLEVKGRPNWRSMTSDFKIFKGCSYDSTAAAGGAVLYPLK